MIRRLRLAFAAVAGGRHRAQSADEKKEAMSPVKKGHSHHMNGHHEKVEVSARACRYCSVSRYRHSSFNMLTG